MHLSQHLVYLRDMLACQPTLMQSLEIKFLVLLVNLAQPVLVPHNHLIIELRMIKRVVLSLLPLGVPQHLLGPLTALKKPPQLLCLVADYLGILLVHPRDHALHLGKLAVQVSALGLLSQCVGPQVVREGR